MVSRVVSDLEASRLSSNLSGLDRSLFFLGLSFLLCESGMLLVAPPALA